MSDGSKFKAEIAPVHKVSDGIAIARIENDRVVSIGYLPERIAASMVDQGKLPGHVFDSTECFFDESYRETAVNSEYLYDVFEDEIEENWERLADLMQQGDESIHVGLCSDHAFYYWV